MIIRDFLKATDPADPKYSENLWLWVRARGKRYLHLNADLARLSVLRPAPEDLVGMNARQMTYLGLREGTNLVGLFGSKLWGILCQGLRAPMLHRALKPNAQDLTATFWPEYVRLGKCFLDPEHEVYDSAKGERWELAGDERTCRWCGARQHLEKTERIVVDERWVFVGGLVKEPPRVVSA
jgi:hypothetical protein